MRGREHRNMLCDVFKYLLQSVPLPSVRHFPNARKCLSRNPVGTAVYFSGSGKERKMALGNSLACFDGSSRLLSRRHQKAGGRQQVPKLHFVKTSRQPLREPRKRAWGENRTEMRESHTPKGMQGESRKPVSATFCRPPRNAVRPELSPRVSPARGMACKRTNRVCMRADSIQSGESPPKPCFSLLPAPAGTALRQKSFVFAESGSFLCGKRFCFYRGKATAGAEKCSIQTVPPSVF